MGVRMSTFSNEDDKKHQQRSIIGFLQTGNQTLSSTECVLDKAEKTEFLKPSEMSHKKSFFDKKRSERTSNHQDTPRCETVGQPSLQTLQPFQASGSETAEKSSNCRTFECPVCFRKQEGVSLDAFTEHVDACLDGPSASENWTAPCYSSASSADAGQKEEARSPSPLYEKQECETGQTSSVDDVDLVEAEEGSLNAAGMETLGHSCGKEENSDIPDKPCPSSLASETVSILSRQVPAQPCADELVTGQALVCPVCNLEQETSDLTLFNVHVDICLNKGIIQELRTSGANSVNQPTERSRNTDRLQKASGRTKRRGPRTKGSTAKKTKPSSPRHTLDIFFK